MEDLQGWQKTRWGMSETEIVTAVGVEHLRRKKREDGDKDTWYVQLIIPSVKIGEYHFDVQFQMSKENDTLVGVLIRYEADPVERPIGAFNIAKHVLTERFGAPQRDGTTDRWNWLFPTTSIFIALLYAENIISQVAIRFTPSTSFPRSDGPSAF